MLFYIFFHKLKEYFEKLNHRVLQRKKTRRTLPVEVGTTNAADTPGSPLRVLALMLLRL